jgi:hypothetical protein
LPTTLNIRQESRKQPDERQERAHVIDGADAHGVGELAEDGSADTAHPERESEE